MIYTVTRNRIIIFRGDKRERLRKHIERVYVGVFGSELVEFCPVPFKTRLIVYIGIGIERFDQNHFAIRVYAMHVVDNLFDIYIIRFRRILTAEVVYPKMNIQQIRVLVRKFKRLRVFRSPARRHASYRLIRKSDILVIIRPFEFLYGEHHEIIHKRLVIEFLARRATFHYAVARSAYL